MYPQAIILLKLKKQQSIGSPARNMLPARIQLSSHVSVFIVLSVGASAPDPEPEPMWGFISLGRSAAVHRSSVWKQERDVSEGMDSPKVLW